MADKAVILGINEYKKVNHLRGCVNDVESMKALLVGRFGFPEANVRTAVNRDVTKEKVLGHLAWLLQEVGEGDRVVLHFSGHGSQIADPSPDADEESDGLDELICLYDMDFSDHETYLTDKELRRWTERVPAGVRLTVVLDNCHSGTGTRLLMAPPGSRSERAAEVIPEATVHHTLPAGGGVRGLGLAGAAGLAAQALTANNPHLVLARYVEPPPMIRQRADEARRQRGRGRRDLVRAGMNHVLLAACKDDQTAADALIGGANHGAFTYYLSEVLANDPRAAAGEVIKALEKALGDNSFDQAPQLEGPRDRPFDRDPVFGPSAAVGAGTATTASPAATPASPASTAAGPPAGVGAQPPAGEGADPHALFERLRKMMAGGGRSDPAFQDEMMRLFGVLLGSARVAAPAGRHLVYVHGICRHVAGYSDGWWDALHPYTNAFGDGARDVTRHEVLWSDLVNARGIRAATDAETSDRAEFAARVRGALEDRMAAHAMRVGPSITSPALHRELVTRDLIADRGLSLPGINCIDDFSVYMFDDGVREQIIGRFTGVVKPLLDAGNTVDIISHSWGTVVAYEGLRALEDAGVTAPNVRNFFTAGAALSIYPVKLRLRPQNRDGRKPAQVGTWINLDASGDPVGGHLQGNPYLVDAEYLDLSNMGCGWFDASCAHGSYFLASNVIVNRDIFAGFIDRS